MCAHLTCVFYVYVQYSTVQCATPQALSYMQLYLHAFERASRQSVHIYAHTTGCAWQRAGGQSVHLLIIWALDRPGTLLPWLVMSADWAKVAIN